MALIAIEVSRQRARIVEMTASARRARVLGSQTIELDPEQTDEERWATIREHLEEAPETLIVGMPGDQTSTRVLAFPFADTKKIEAALDFELESQIPYDLEDVVATWSVTERSGDGARVLAAVAPREGLVERLAAMENAELEARSVALPAASLVELLPEDAGEEAVAVLALGSHLSHFAVSRGGLRFARTLRTGGVAIDRRLAHHYNVSEESARAAKEKEARLVLDTSVVSQDVVDLSSQVELGLKPLLRELGATFRALDPENKPKKIYLTGGLSRLPGLAEYLAVRLGVEVVVLDLGHIVEGLSGNDGESPSSLVSLGPEYAPAFALALSQLRRGSQVPLNFRRGEFSYSGDFAVYRGEITRIAVGIAAVFLIALIGAAVRLSILSGEEERIDQGFCTATKAIIGTEICNPQRALAVLKEPSNTAGGVVIPIYSATDLLDVMSGLLKADVTFEDLEFEVKGRVDEPDQVTGKGEAKDFETIQQVKAQLEADPCIGKAEISRQKRKRDAGRVEFSIEVDVQCPAGVKPGSTIVATE